MIYSIDMKYVLNNFLHKYEGNGLNDQTKFLKKKIKITDSCELKIYIQDLQMYRKYTSRQFLSIRSKYYF